MLMAPPPGYSPMSINRQSVQGLGAPGPQGTSVLGNTLGASAPHGNTLGMPGGHTGMSPPMPGGAMQGPPLGGMGNSMNMATALGR